MVAKWWMACGIRCMDWKEEQSKTILEEVVELGSLFSGKCWLSVNEQVQLII